VILVLIMLYCSYEFSVEILSMFVHSAIIYKIYKGFIIGVIISKIISLKFSYFNRDKGEKNKKVKNISVILTVIVILFLSIVENVELGFDLIQRVYCDNEDVVVSDSTKSNIEKDDNSYHFSISKRFVKDGYDTVLKVLSDSLPEIIGGMGAAKIGATVIKATPKLPPLQRAVLGVFTGGASMIAIGLGGVVVKNVRQSSAPADADGEDLFIKVPRSS
jgi:hypothetical protein